jgi:DsbC/DsbD-like thiol-disulfide interchange protein
MTVLRFGLVLAMALAASTEASAVRSDWVAADEAKMRLLIAGPRDRHVAAGIEIVLEPGWHTYWHNPGETGVPPVFDFSGSRNIANVEVLYPVPERLDDGTSVSLVYNDAVVFPLKVTLAKPGEPVTLDVQAIFGVCAEVCIPTRASAAATLAPDAPRDPLAEARLDAFAPLVPKPAEPGRFEVLSAMAEGDAILITVRMPDSTYSDLFADPPEGWYIGQPRFVSRAEGVSRYRLSLAGKPKDAAARGKTFSFVAAAGGEAIEQDVEIR